MNGFDIEIKCQCVFLQREILIRFNFFHNKNPQIANSFNPATLQNNNMASW